MSGTEQGIMDNTRHTDSILVVEDDRFFRELYADMLSGAGYTVVAADCGEEALVRLQQDTFGLVLTDLSMPGISGLELLTRIKSRDPSIDMMLITAHADLESALFSLRHGARDYLLKPINQDQLLHAVQLCMEQRRLLSENVELRNMVGLLQTSQTLAGSLDLDAVCHLALDALAREAGTERGMVLLQLEDSDEYMIKECKGLDAEAAAALHDAVLLSMHKRSSSRRGQLVRIAVDGACLACQQADIREALVVPLLMRSGCAALAVVANGFGVPLPELKSERNIEFLVEHGGRALDNALRYSATQEMLYLDELSGLFNYRYLKIALEREMKRADRYATKLSVLFLDLDNFKQVNDTYGHLVGSSLLRELGQLLRCSVREVDVVIRYGGDEYTVILVETEPDMAQQVAERLRRMIESHSFMEQDGYQIRLTASLGLASYPDDTTELTDLLSMADKAMYAGKAAGKNCVYRVPDQAPIYQDKRVTKEYQ